MILFLTINNVLQVFLHFQVGHLSNEVESSSIDDIIYNLNDQILSAKLLE